MSAETVIILIGAVLILLAIIDSISSINLLNPKLRIPMGALGILLLIFGGYSYGAVNMPGQIEQAELGNTVQIEYPVEKIQVLSPVEGDSVKCRILTMGVYPNDHKKDIWVLLKPSDGKFYPQSDHTNTSFKRNGEWQVITRFGGDKAESYDVLVYETDASASEFFSSTIQQWKDQNSYPGLEVEDLPAGAKLVENVVVYLKENCRGVF